MTAIYAINDFTETIDRVGIRPEQIEHVLAVWAKSRSYWSGGFLLQLRDGRIAYITGWCDSTGWGCQDGASVYYYSERPTLVPGAFPHDPPFAPTWDEDPIDLNRWLADPSGFDVWDQVSG